MTKAELMKLKKSVTKTVESLRDIEEDKNRRKSRYWELSYEDRVIVNNAINDLKMIEGMLDRIYRWNHKDEA